MKSTLAPLLAVLLPLGLHAAPPPRFGGITLQTHDFNTATIVAGGADIWQAADSFVFHCFAVTNDFDFRLRVLSVEDGTKSIWATTTTRPFQAAGLSRIALRI